MLSSDADGVDRAASGGFDGLDDEERAERLEAELMRAHHLAGLGSLVPRVAHDLRNELMVIQGNAALLAMAAEQPGRPEVGEERDQLAEIQQAAARAAGIIDQLRLHAHHGRLELVPLVLSEVVDQGRALLRLAVPPGITLRFELEAGLPAVLADAGRLREVLLNLVTNAADAMGGDGTVTIRTRRVGAHVDLVVEDEGPGIDDAAGARFAEPLVTTKPGRVGLGLAIVQDTVLAHDATLHFAAAPPEGGTTGTQVTVRFPATLGTEAGEPVPADPAVSPTARETSRSGPRGGTAAAGGVVLVVDDDEGIRTLIRRVLGRVGVTVVEAADGDEALAIHAARRDLDLVVLDVSMPGTPGDVVHERLTAADPALPVLILTGFSAAETRARFPTGIELTLVHKPFDIHHLRGVITSMLESSLEQANPTTP